LNTLFFLPRMIRPLPWQKFPLLARYLLSPGWNFGSWLSSPHTVVLASINMSFRWQVRESIKIVKRASVQFIEEADHSIGNQSFLSALLYGQSPYIRSLVNQLLSHSIMPRSPRRQRSRPRFCRRANVYVAFYRALDDRDPLHVCLGLDLSVREKADGPKSGHCTSKIAAATAAFTKS